MKKITKREAQRLFTTINVYVKNDNGCERLNSGSSFSSCFTNARLKLDKCADKVKFYSET